MSLTRNRLLQQFFRHNKTVVFIAVLSAFFSSLCSVLLPLSIGSFYQVAFHESSGKSALLEKAGFSPSDLNSFFAFFITLTLLKGLLTWLEHYSMRMLEERVSSDIRKRLFHAQLNQELSAFQLKSPGKYLARYSSEMLAIQQFVSKGLAKTIADGLFLIVAFLLLFELNAQLSKALLAVFLIGAILMMLVSNKQKAPNETRRSARSSLLGFIEQRLHAIMTVKAFNRAHIEEQKFEKRNAKVYESAIAFQRVNGLNKSLPQFMFFAAIGLLLYIASAQANGSSASLLIFILVLLYLQSVYKRLLRVPALLTSGSTSFRNLIALLNLPHETMHQATDKELSKEDLNIEFRNLQFAYREGQTVLSGFNASMSMGHIYALKGASGSGKSTVLKLLLKLIAPKANSIFIGGKDITAIGSHDLRKMITIVSDDYPLLGKTVFEAISYSRKDAKRGSTAKMLSQLNITTEEHSIGYLDRTIQPGAADLSSAERRMLQFARSALTSKPILLLDEPFTGLSEHHVIALCNYLHTIQHKRIILIISAEMPEHIQIDQTFSL
jgi:ABC-type multidrug transport system fused ATPase/permease subunit